MNALIVLAMILIIAWAIISIVFKATAFVINALPLIAVILLAWWALKRFA